MSTKAHDKYRKSRPARFELTCSDEEKAMIYELAELVGKKKNQMIIDMIREKLKEIKGGTNNKEDEVIETNNNSTGFDPSDCLEVFDPYWDDDMTDGQFSDWLFKDDYC